MTAAGASSTTPTTRPCFWAPKRAEYEARCEAAPRAAAGPCFRCNAPDSPRAGRRRWLCRRCIHETSRPGILPAFAVKAAEAILREGREGRSP